jgi:myosin regulatory light chain 12
LKTKEALPMKRRQKRQNSNIFHMLGKNQIVELREAFNLLDNNSDSIVDKADLESFLGSIGSPFTEREIDEMMGEACENMTFMLFLTMIGERLSCTDTEKAIAGALQVFDDRGDHFIDEDVLRKWLTEEGDRMSHEDVDLLLRGCVEDGRINCKSLTGKMKYGEIVTE